MKLVGVLSTAALCLTLGIAVPAYAQEQHDEKDKAASQQEEKKAQPEQKKAQQEQPAKQEEKGAQQEKNGKQEEKNAQQKQGQPQAKPVEQAQHNGGGRIPADRFKANFGQDHRFHVSQAEYSNGRRFQYGGYWFGFVDPWPSNWLYTQDVYVVDINGVYYLCNPMYPGVNIALSFTL
ncbi:MAG: hypothetical protein WBQ72_10990 [Terriglobales bacterium]|jgi:hypothetical protein